MTTLFAIVDWHPALWLAAFCAPLLAAALTLGCMPRRHHDMGEIRIGNSLLRGRGRAQPPEVQTHSLLHLCRTLEVAELRPLVSGMRHLPWRETIPLLRRQLKSSDPELQLYAQCVLQEGQATLQDHFQMLAQKAASRKSPALLASFLEAAFALLRSPLTPTSEHKAIVERVQDLLSPRLEELSHPRALHAAAMYFLQLNQPAQAQAMQARLPVGSPLHTDLVPRLMHVAFIQSPPPVVSSNYQMS
ncbi:hypothetical protein DES53_101309 [Roseimicrobium gellanilyticum]|uniref:Uncharacterized protein n=1 Tax=Roseimicrobium gellanilyticum TaxID=748857 RepID=A0A366HTB4_9BACT|nr:hypothetical protein [Roseimicrobium gellanilyticum]RBP47512.1 hypothetical protein DES53_101309 [Roseimicrobium gellanilyticum]